MTSTAPEPVAVRIPAQLRETARYERHDPAIGGSFWMRRIDPVLDTPLITSWMNEPHVSEFWLMAWPQAQIAAYLEQLHADAHHDAYVVHVDDTPIGYVEAYDPAHDVLGSAYEVQEGDLGFHVLIGDKEHLGRYTVSLGMSVLDYAFTGRGARRVVGEPDVRNHQMLTILAFLGFRKACEVELPDKRAALMICVLEDFSRLRTRPRRR